jgi:hypothetical protein
MPLPDEIAVKARLCLAVVFPPQNRQSGRRSELRASRVELLPGEASPELSHWPIASAVVLVEWMKQQGLKPAQKPSLPKIPISRLREIIEK